MLTVTDDTGWWFGTFWHIFLNLSYIIIGNNVNNWRIFFRGVETTNQDIFEPNRHGMILYHLGKHWGRSTKCWTMEDLSCSTGKYGLRKEALVPLSTRSGLLEPGPSVWLEGNGSLQESPGGNEAGAAGSSCGKKWTNLAGIKKVETIINIINHEYFVEILTQRKGTFGPWPSMALSTFQRHSRHFFWGHLMWTPSGTFRSARRGASSGIGAGRSERSTSWSLVLPNKVVPKQNQQIVYI